MLRLLRSYPVDRWLLWVGAGVSAASPSSLPLGWVLTQFALQATCGIHVQQRIFQIWDQANRILATPTDSAPLGAIPRLESVLGEIETTQRFLILPTQLNFMRGFKSFEDVPYNHNHICLASLLQQGATVVTANFDGCIESAYRDLTLGQDELVLSQRHGVPCYRSRSGLRIGNVFHFHGTATDVPGLGATLGAVKQGLPTAFRRFLTSRFQRGTAVLFLGYSASDVFDVNFYFTSFGHAHFASSAAVFVQHGIALAPSNAKVLTQCFGHSALENEDTTACLSRLSGNPAPRALMVNFDWVSAFLQAANLGGVGELRPFLTCRIANLLGMNVNLLDPIAEKKALEQEHAIEPAHFHNTMTLVYRTQGRVRRDRRHQGLVSDLLGHHLAHGQYSKALRFCRILDELLHTAAALKGSILGRELPWELFTETSTHARALVEKYLSKPHLATVSGADLRKIWKLRRIMGVLASLPLGSVLFVNQVATMWRLSMILQALADGTSDAGAAERSLRLYVENASIVGVINTYRDIAVRDLLLCRRDGGTRPEGLMSARKSHELAILIGDVRGQRIADQLINCFVPYG